jgi:hypothetical protein
LHESSTPLSFPSQSQNPKEEITQRRKKIKKGKKLKKRKINE